MNLLLADHPEMKYAGSGVVASCDYTTYPSIYFYINGRYYEVPPSQYVV